MSFVGPITDKIINELKKELKKEETQAKIKESFKPIINNFVNRNKKYIYVIVMFFLILFFLIVYNTYLLKTMKNK